MIVTLNIYNPVDKQGNVIEPNPSFENELVNVTELSPSYKNEQYHVYCTLISFLLEPRLYSNPVLNVIQH